MAVFCISLERLPPINQKVNVMKNKVLNLLYVGAIIIFIIFPQLSYWSKNYYIVHIACLIGIYIILAIGLNIVIGFLGLLDLGYIAFYGIGAYTSMLLSIHYQIGFFPVLIITVIVVVFFRLLLGAPVLRLRGDYLAIVTLAFGEITRIFLNNCDVLTNGPKGLPRVGQEVLKPQLFFFTLSNDLHFYYLIGIFVVILIVLTRRIENSRIGRAFVAIREDEVAAEVMGIPTPNIKLIGFALSGVFAGCAGCIYTHWIGFVTPEVFTFWQSILLVCMVILGGMGSINGVILGVFLLVGIPELLREILGTKFVLYRMLIFGIIIVAIIILRPQGLIPSKRIQLEFQPDDEKIKEEESQSLYDVLHDKGEPDIRTYTGHSH
ncbi:MAG: branched-chain amino acid ABC transporter permease [bacterium]